MNNIECRILFDDTEVLSMVTNYYPRLYIKIDKHRNNFNVKEEFLRFNRSWLTAPEKKKKKLKALVYKPCLRLTNGPIAGRRADAEEPK